MNRPQEKSGSGGICVRARVCVCCGGLRRESRNIKRFHFKE